MQSKSASKSDERNDDDDDNNDDDDLYNYVYNPNVWLTLDVKKPQDDEDWAGRRGPTDYLTAGLTQQLLEKQRRI